MTNLFTILFLGLTFSTTCLSQVEKCNSQEDNDNDGLIGCDDSDCRYPKWNCPDICISCLGDDQSFADELIEYTLEGLDPSDLAAGNFNSLNAIGVPNFNPNSLISSVGLGGSGFIKLGFTDNILTNSGNDKIDIWVFEVGGPNPIKIELHPLNQITESKISTVLIDDDLDGYYTLGNFDGHTSGIDIDKILTNFSYKELLFDAIKISNGSTTSFNSPDIDAVCAATSIHLEICNNGLDDDGDGFTDCEDQDCPQNHSIGCLECQYNSKSYSDTILMVSLECESELWPGAINPESALGPPDYVQSNSQDPIGDGFVSLGNGGMVSLGFNDNILTNSGDTQPDLWIFEVSVPYDTFLVSLKPYNNDTEVILEASGLSDDNNDGYFEFDTIQGPNTWLDIDNYISNQKKELVYFNGVQIIGVFNNSIQNCNIDQGPDIDAVCAISSVSEACSYESLQGLTSLDIIQVSGCHCDGALELKVSDSNSKYQWYKDGILLINKTEPSLVLTELDSLGEYTIVTKIDSICYISSPYKFDKITKETVLNKSICENEEFVFFDSNLTESGIYSEQIFINNICDSIFKLELAVNSTFDTSYVHILCPEDTLILGDLTITTPGFYSKLFLDQNGCDSIHFVEASLPNIEFQLDLIEEELVVKIRDDLNYTFSNSQDGLKFSWLYNNQEVSTTNKVEIYDVYVGGFLTLEVTTNEGCQLRDSILIKIDKENLLYLPNIANLHKEKFTIGFNTAVTYIDKLQIFDKWGSIVFTYSGSPENLHQWDRNDLQKGVYTISIECTLIDGSSILEIESLLLM